MRQALVLLGLAIVGAACSSTSGTPVKPDQLGYSACLQLFDCGPGRYCNQEGFCWADCRSTADCSLLGPDMICSLFGQCLPKPVANVCTQDRDCPKKQCHDFADRGKRCISCQAHADCGAGSYCNGKCETSGASCGANEDCPYHQMSGENCLGTCSTPCGNDNDCMAFGADLTCTPIGQCLEAGWEKWVPPGELPPTNCNQDAQCKVRGWPYGCDCDKEPNARTGRILCAGGGESTCKKSTDPIDFGDGPAQSAAHAFRGTWGMRLEIGVVSIGLPLVNKENTYSSNLFLVKASHREGDTLELEEKLCQLNLINFSDDDQPFVDLAWMVIPNLYLRALPINTQAVQITSAANGAPFEASDFTEVRGCILEHPNTDPLPNRHDYDNDPNDPRIWDEDGDGHPGMTTLMDGVLRGEIYNVQRWGAILHGTILDSDHVRGLNEIHNEQLVLSASKSTLIYDISTEIHQQADRTYFRLMRLADEAGCADLIRESSRQDSWLRHTPHLMDVADP